MQAVNDGPFAEVAVPVPVDGTFEYRVPADCLLEPGVRVMVPYSGRIVTGFVLAVRESRSHAGRREPRSIDSVVDAAPVLPAALLGVVLRAAHETLCPPGIALAAAIPPGTAPRPGFRLRLGEEGRRALERGQARGELGRVLWALGRNELPETTLRRRFPDAAPALDKLERLGWIERFRSTEPPRVRRRTARVYHLVQGDLGALRERLRRAPRQLEIVERLARAPAPLPASAPLRALLDAEIVRVEERELSRRTLPPPISSADTDFELTPAQRESLARIIDAAESRRDATYLLYGITGSGKTEVYLRATERAVSLGRGAIILVPEISLTHQVVDRFRARFGDTIAVLHSGLSEGERFDQWRGLREGRFPIAIGARSAIFAPIEDLGLIVIDEEHDGAYKSEEGFRYHARQIAELRSRESSCPLVLGSATPDVETSYRAERGEIERLVLPQRVARRPLPEVEIVDMEREPRLHGRRPLLSRALRSSLVETLAAGRQSILFLNRRGFATMVYCFSCGHGLHCEHCDISLVYHSSGGPRRIDVPEQGELRCHYCGYTTQPSPTCPSCKSPEGALFGFGTERVQEEVQGLFPDARVARLDRDTSARKGAQRGILQRFHRGEIDVLVGTQMVAKGHDVPNVTLVGVLAADLGLHFPDFRAGERTFQLLTQVAGRAGRGEEPGRVVIQSFLPKHYAIALARTHDYPGFYREELARRRPHGYPPFRSVVHVLVAGADHDAVESAAALLATRAKSVLRPDSEPFELLGPAPAPIPRIRDRFRWQLLLLGGRESVREIGRELQRFGRRQLRGVTLRVDPAPLQML
jgi:primosomal protein N' (replication factor Y)